MNDKDQPVADATSEEEKTYPVIAVICDQGHYGFDKCGKCHETLVKDHVGDCPHCGAHLKGVEPDYGVGGSDF
jgi:hypothetical protein